MFLLVLITSALLQLLDLPFLIVNTDQDGRQTVPDGRWLRFRLESAILNKWVTVDSECCLW